ncbi:MAG TPA: hypothetical protein VF025_04230, partial [Gaiellaceae bacterium]
MRAGVRLVTFDDGKVGELRNGRVLELDAPSMRAYFEQGARAAPTGREHEEESKRVGWSHEIAPWIVFFQNVDAIVGPDEPVVYPEHLTEEL